MSSPYFFPLMLDPKEYLMYGLSHDNTQYGIFGGGGIGESKNLGYKEACMISQSGLYF